MAQVREHTESTRSQYGLADKAAGLGWARTSIEVIDSDLGISGKWRVARAGFTELRVCGNKPVRADYLDQVVWDHITGLLADPALIRTEISKRLQQARTSDPATRQRTQLELALAKACASITAMIEAYSEQLITLDELRAKMPHLRARQASLRGQLDALDAQAANRDAYLKLADGLEGFLAQLRGTAATASTEERLWVLRLLVKDVLIGPDKITIRHRIPAREPAGAGGGHHDTTDTEGDMRQSYEPCWGRGIVAARERVPALRLRLVGRLVEETPRAR